MLRAGTPIVLVGFVVIGCSSTGETPTESCRRAPFGVEQTVLKGDSAVNKRDELISANLPLALCELEGDSSLPMLKDAHSIVINALPSANIDFPQLEIVRQQISIEGAPRVSAPKLRQVRRFYYNNSRTNDVRTVKLPNLVDINELTSFARRTEVPVLEQVGNVDALGLVAPKLKRADVVSAWAAGLPALESVDAATLLISTPSTSSIATMPVLQTARSLSFWGDAAVISLPALTEVDSLGFANMPSLQRIEIPSLQSVRELRFSGNTSLSGCEIARIAAKLNPEALKLEGNELFCPE